MYYHGAGYEVPKPYRELAQTTCLAVSDDGIRFDSDDLLLGTSYLRIFEWDDHICVHQPSAADSPKTTAMRPSSVTCAGRR